MPAPERHYRDEAGRSYHFDKRRLPAVAYPWVARSRRNKFGRHVQPGDTVVEFGVGAGWNLSELDCGRKVGLDVADFLAEDMRDRGIEFVSSPAQLGDHEADVVICHHMLEHVPSPIDTLCEIRRVLRPSGTLLLFVPYEVQRRFRAYDPDEPNHHLYAWNPQTLGALVAESGFTVRSAGLGDYGYDRFAAALAAKLRLGERGFAPIRRVAHTLRPVREVRIMATPHP